MQRNSFFLMQQSRTARITFWLAVVLAVAFTIAVCSNGVPTLRHDWAWPRERYAFVDLLIRSTSGWAMPGIGAPTAHPDAYILSLALSVMGMLAGPLPALAGFVFAIGMAIAIAARSLSKTLHGSLTQTVTVELFALFNPWVYNEAVAGHLYMLLAYGGLLAIFSELLREEVRARRLSLLLLLILPQLQFFVLAMLAVTIHAVMRRTFLAFVSGVIVATPIWIGLLWDRPSLLQTPYTLAWETSQSVNPAQALVLMGYFANYTAHYAWFHVLSAWIALACVVTAIACIHKRVVRVTLFSVMIFLVAVTGTRGPLGPAFTSLVVHFPESGLFRELYDLLGIVAIGYCALLLSIPRWGSFRIVNIVALAAVMVLTTAWLVYPPSSYWVNARDVPLVDAPLPPNTRFALYPAYQPMRFQNKGSGADPDLYARPGNVTPINEYLAVYPVNVALSSYTLNRDPAPLAALSTGLIVERPWLNSDVGALRLQMSGAPGQRTVTTLTYKRIEALPEVTLQQYPEMGSLVNDTGAGNIFFADANSVVSSLAPMSWRRLPEFDPVHVSNLFVDESKGWIDVRFRFAAEPMLGEGLGGAVTSNANSVLPLRPGSPSLVNVNGTLLSQDGHVVYKTTHGYQWIPLGPRVTGVRCLGECVVVGQSSVRTHLPLNPPKRAFRTVEFTELAPWFLRVNLPRNAPPVLRLNVAYDPHWVALARGHTTAHIRLDACVNGWLISRTVQPYTLYLFHSVSLAQTVAELLGLIWVTVLLLNVPRNGKHLSLG